MDKDSYYKKAKREGYPSRAVYKLIEIDDRFRIFQEKAGFLTLEPHRDPGLN
jgi:23S rRNA methylase